MNQTIADLKSSVLAGQLNHLKREIKVIDKNFDLIVLVMQFVDYDKENEEWNTKWVNPLVSDKEDHEIFKVNFKDINLNEAGMKKKKFIELWVERVVQPTIFNPKFYKKLNYAKVVYAKFKKGEYSIVDERQLVSAKVRPDDMVVKDFTPIKKKKNATR